MNILKTIMLAPWLLALLLLPGCHTSYDVVSIEGGKIPMTAAYDEQPDQQAAEILDFYKRQVDDIMNEVIGHSTQKLESYQPESPLSNLIADIIKESAEQKTGMKVDMAVMNMGGIRNILNEGDITIGDIFQICPFENTLAVLTMSGEVLAELLEQIASLHGEGLSGARLTISKEGMLLSAEVGGKPIDKAKDYIVATIDYLAEGNDRMEAFKKADKKTFPENGVLRDVFIEYVRNLDNAGKAVTAKVEGRVSEE